MVSPLASSQVPSVSTPDSSPPPGDRIPPPGILVVDDDPHILGFLRAALPDHGFQVWTAEDGPSAVRLFEEHREEIRVVLLDVRMPDLDGPQTLERLQAIDPDVVSCFMTGHSGEYSEADLAARGPRHCFHKPFRLPEIVRALRELTS